MKNFNIHRFGLTLRQDLFSHKRLLMRTFLGMFAGCFLILMIAFFEDIVAPTQIMIDGSLQFDYANHDHVKAFMTVVIFVVFLQGASLIFSNLRTKEERIAFLALPATRLEKFLVRWIYGTVVYVALFCLALIAADLLRYAITLLIGPGRPPLVFPEVFADIVPKINVNYVGGTDFNETYVRDVRPWILASLAMISVWLHSVYMLGSSLFRKYAWINTTIAGIAIFLVLVVVISNLPDMELETKLTSSGMSKACVAVAFVLTVFNYWASYRVFSRIQVVPRKWINI